MIMYYRGAMAVCVKLQVSSILFYPFFSNVCEFSSQAKACFLLYESMTTIVMNIRQKLMGFTLDPSRHSMGLILVF